MRPWPRVGVMWLPAGARQAGKAGTSGRRVGGGHCSAWPTIGVSRQLRIEVVPCQDQGPPSTVARRLCDRSGCAEPGGQKPLPQP